MQLIDQPLSQIARRMPGSTAILQAHDLDFCCGGKRSLREAAAAKGVDAAAVAAQLLALPQPENGAGDWGSATADALIDHILTRYHAVHRQQLPELIRLARKVEDVHAARPSCPLGLAAHLQTMQQELESHMQKEEQVLFPLLREGHRATAPIAVMRSEHDHHGESLARLAALTDGFRPPRDACTTWRALYLGLATLRDDLMQHIHLENNILFEPAATARN